MLLADHPNYTDGGIGVRVRTFVGDPRLSKQQIIALDQTTQADPEALILGFDENMLPVVRARVGIPRTSRSWAIKRNGDPATAARVFHPFHYGD